MYIMPIKRVMISTLNMFGSHPVDQHDKSDIDPNMNFQ